MFGGKKIKIPDALYEQLEKYSQKAGYSSVNEFVIHRLEREMTQVEESVGASEEEIKKKLQGLGYID